MRQGVYALYFGFYESPARLLGKADGVGISLGAAAAQGRIAFLWQPPLEYVLDELGYKLLGAVAAFGLARSGHVFVRAIIGMALGWTRDASPIGLIVTEAGGRAYRRHDGTDLGVEVAVGNRHLAPELSALLA